MKWGLAHRNDTGLNTFRHDIGALFDDFFNFAPVGYAKEEFLPRIDVAEDENGIHLVAELPGLTEKDINITVEDNVLTISGEKKTERKEEKNEKYYYSERSFGSFTRAMTLPRGLKVDEIRAEYRNGLLKVDLPKAEELKPKKIDINVN